MEKIYTPQKEDFEFVEGRNLEVDTNFASQGYWRGVFVHFTKNKFAITGVFLVAVIIFLYGIIDPRISLTAKDG